MHRRTALSLLAALPVAPRAWAESSPRGWPGDAEWRQVPPSVNAVLVADVQRFYQSPIGQREGWARRFAESHHASLTSLPPSVAQALVAQQMDFGLLQARWQVGLIRSARLITLGDVARLEGSAITTVGERSAVPTPRNAFVTSTGDRLLAVYSPADRQAFARWTRTVAGSGFTGQSEYVRSSVAAAGDAHLVIAADLSDMIDQTAAQTYFGALPAATNNRIHPANLARLFAGLRGVTLHVNAGESLTGRLRFDFSTPIGDLGRHLPEIIEALLADAGAIVDDFKDWKDTVGERSFELSGAFTSGGLNHILMLFELAGAPSEHERRERAEGQRGDPVATLRYFRSLNNLLTELRNVRFRDNFERYASWFDIYARKIDDLPTRGVDPELSNWGYQLAGWLRAMAASLRGVPLRAQEVAEGAFTFVTTTGGGNRRWGWWGGSHIDTNVPQARAEIARIVAEDKDARNRLWQRIDDDLGSLRRKLSARYSVNF
jgi:hypothetical protein